MIEDLAVHLAVVVDNHFAGHGADCQLWPDLGPLTEGGVNRERGRERQGHALLLRPGVRNLPNKNPPVRLVEGQRNSSAVPPNPQALPVAQRVLAVHRAIATEDLHHEHAALCAARGDHCRVRVSPLAARPPGKFELAGAKHLGPEPEELVMPVPGLALLRDGHLSRGPRRRELRRCIHVVILCDASHGQTVLEAGEVAREARLSRPSRRICLIGLLRPRQSVLVMRRLVRHGQIGHSQNSFTADL